MDYRFTQINVADLGACDLQAEAAGYRGPKEAYRIELAEDFDRPETHKAEAAQALYLPREGRMGIAWGGDATWADVTSAEQGIAMWATDSEAWEAAN